MREQRLSEHQGTGPHRLRLFHETPKVGILLPRLTDAPVSEGGWGWDWNNRSSSLSPDDKSRIAARSRRGRLTFLPAHAMHRWEKVRGGATKQSKYLEVHVKVVADHRLPQALAPGGARAPPAPHGPGLERLRGGRGRGDHGRRSRRRRRGRGRRSGRSAAGPTSFVPLLLLLLPVDVRFGLAVFCGRWGGGRAGAGGGEA